MKTLIKLVAVFVVSAALVPAVAQENPKLSDAEVASVAVVANQIDISYADIAKHRRG